MRLVMPAAELVQRRYNPAAYATIHSTAQSARPQLVDASTLGSRKPALGLLSGERLEVRGQAVVRRLAVADRAAGVMAHAGAECGPAGAGGPAVHPAGQVSPR